MGQGEETSLRRLGGGPRPGLLGRWAGEKPLDPVWRWAVGAEGDTSSEVVGTVLVDVAAFYESLDHAELMAAARRHHFPEALARAALDLYAGAARHVRNGVFLARPRWATRGVVAGCSLATTFVKTIFADPARRSGPKPCYCEDERIPRRCRVGGQRGAA